MSCYCRDTIWKVLPDLGASSDFSVYHHAAQQVVRGKSPFSIEVYIYPPLLAFLMTPLVLLDYVTARWVWFLLSHACLAMTAWLVWRGLGRDWAAAGSIAFVWALGGAASESLALGQLGPLLTLLLVLGYTRPSALGFGLALKFIPGVQGIALALRQQWKAVLWMLASAVVLLALPWGIVACCLAGPKAPAGTDTWTGTPATLSWSLPSVVLRALDPPQRGGALPHNWEAGGDLPNLRLPRSHRFVSVGVAFMTLLAGTIVLVVALRGRLEADRVPWAMAALTSLVLAASPVSWTHYQVMQYPGLALLLSYAWRLRLWRLVAWTVACGAMLYPLPVAVLAEYYRKNGGWTAASPETLYFWTSVTPVASLILFGLLVKEARACSTGLQPVGCFTNLQS